MTKKVKSSPLAVIIFISLVLISGLYSMCKPKAETNNNYSQPKHERFKMGWKHNK